MDKKKMLSFFCLCSVVLNTTISFNAQTLDELEKEIETLQAETQKQRDAKEDVKTEKANTEAELLDLKEEIKNKEAEIATQQSKINSKNAEIEEQKLAIKEVQDKIPETKDKAGEALALLQKADNSNIMLQMLITPSDAEDNNILRRIDSLNVVSEYAGGIVLELVELEKELQYEKLTLDKQKAELDAEELNLEIQNQELAEKEKNFNEVIAAQTEEMSKYDNAASKSTEDAQMKADALAYYQSLGCDGSDTVGSKCGILTDSDNDGIADTDDSCPNEYGEDGYGCPIVETSTDDDDSTSDNTETNTGNNNSGGSNGGGNSSGGNSGGNSNTGTDASFIKPLSHGVVTCEYACYTGHVGIDLDNADYDPIHATSDGVVTTARGGCAPFAAGVNTCNGGYGNYVMVTHYTNNGIYFSLYAHLSSINVSQGQSVSQGQTVGLLGDSGNSAGSHLHFELYKDANNNGIPDDAKTNPRNYVSFPDTWNWW